MSINTEVMGLKKPTLNDKKGDTISELAANFDIIAGLFPIGSIYQSTKNTDPSTFIPGTIWTPLRGRMLIGESEEFPINTTGGEKEHTLTINEMPRHRHAALYEGKTPAIGGSSFARGPQAGWDTDQPRIDHTGGSQAHNNMPPYKAVYMWERTA